jgi:hypothetical protein
MISTKRKWKFDGQKQLLEQSKGEEALPRTFLEQPKGQSRAFR